MLDTDDVIVGQRAKAWCKVIGGYGDPHRMIVVNKLVACVLNHFGGEGGRERIAKPHALIQKCMANLSAAEIKPIEAQVQDLVNAHKDTCSWTAEFPSLKGTSLLDLGSGNGYLGGWLSTLGVRYTGVEPSADLHQAAKGDRRLAEASLFQATIRHFCENDSDQLVEAPTLISIIGVIDQLADPEDSMRSLFDLLARRKWLHVPVLVATFDPDFFLPGLPIRDFVLQTAAHYGVTEPLGIRDPAAWEELFVSSGFHLLEQRPLHISGLPPALSAHLHALHECIFASNASAFDGEAGGERTTMARVPPRQGPFYFWLLCPRNVSIERRVAGATALVPSYVERVAKDVPLSVIGNLGVRVFRLIEGSAFFDSPETGPMFFCRNDIFGQLEASCNYVASRILGTLATSADSRFETTESRKILSHLETSSSFSDELWLSLLRHLISVQFAPYISGQRSDKLRNKVLTGSYSRSHVRNIAACLLQEAAKMVPDASSHGYRSRILVEIDVDQIRKFIYGHRANREAESLLMEILSELVQSNVIDSFSAYRLEESNAQEKIEDLEDKTENRLEPLHIGWQTARFIHHCFLLHEAEQPFIRLAQAISAFLGSPIDSESFQTEWKKDNQSAINDHQMVGGGGRPKTRPMPKYPKALRNHVVDLVQCSEEECERLRCFLDKLRWGFTYHHKNKEFSEKYGLSRFVVVRDIWALLACLLDKGDMWNTGSKKRKEAKDYMSQKEQKPRIIAYIQECIAYAGRQSGLDKCPW